MSTTTPARLVLITTFGLGYLRPAPGTWGSLPPALIAAALVLLQEARTPTWYIVLSGLALAFSLACVMGGPAAEARFGRKDPSEAVADETAAMALTLVLLPPFLFATTAWALATIAAAFVLFRLADIAKLWPAGGLQRLPAGWGILMDDVAAALQSAAILWLGGWALVRSI